MRQQLQSWRWPCCSGVPGRWTIRPPTGAARDGLNTQDRWYNNASSIDTRQRILCDNIKSAGVTIYTVQVNTGKRSDLERAAVLRQHQAAGGRGEQVLPAHAVDTDRHTFNQIGTSLSKLRLANWRFADENMRHTMNRAHVPIL